MIHLTCVHICVQVTVFEGVDYQLTGRADGVGYPNFLQFISGNYADPQLCHKHDDPVIVRAAQVRT